MGFVCASLLMWRRVLDNAHQQKHLKPLEWKESLVLHPSATDNYPLFSELQRVSRIPPNTGTGLDHGMSVIFRSTGVSMELRLGGPATRRNRPIDSHTGSLPHGSSCMAPTRISLPLSQL